MKTITSFLPFCILIAACTQDKNGKQQEIKAYLQQSDSLLQVNKGEARAYAQKALELSVGLKDLALESVSRQKLANAVRFNVDLEILFDYDNTAVEIAREAKDEIVLCDALDAYTKDLLATENLAKADTFMTEEKKYIEMTDDKECKAKYLNTYGLYCLRP